MAEFDASGAGGAVSFRAIPGIWFVDPTAPAGGNGAYESPFNSLASAIAAAPSLPATTHLMLAPVDFTAEGRIDYVDKRFTVEGTSIFNDSGTSTPTHGVFLGPTSSDDSNMVLEMVRVNCNIIPRSHGIAVFGENCNVEMLSDGTHFASYNLQGAPDTCGCGNTGPVSSIVSQGARVLTLGLVVNGGVALESCHLEGGPAALSLPNAGTSSSTFTNSRIGASITAAHLLKFWCCTFPADGTSIILDAPAVETDLATYARGVESGVTWPELVTLIDVNVPLQPVFVAAGVGSNSNGGSPTPAYGANIAGDTFFCLVAGLGVPQVPTMPAGWTKQAEKISGALILQWWTRDAVSAGSEVGTVTVTVGGGGNSPTVSVIETWRSVANPIVIESLATAATAGAGPTVVGGPTVAATGLGRKALCLTASNGGATTATVITGQSGATWRDRDQWASGLGGLIDVQAAALAGTNPVSGGTLTIPGTLVVQISAAIAGAIV